jgi:hypothetical protein
MNSSIAAGEGSLEISAEVGGSLEDMQPISISSLEVVDLGCIFRKGERLVLAVDYS